MEFKLNDFMKPSESVEDKQDKYLKIPQRCDPQGIEVCSNWLIKDFDRRSCQGCPQLIEDER